MSKNETVALEPIAVTDSDWAAFVADHENATVFHTPEWFSAIEATFGYEPNHLVCKSPDGKITGLVPGVTVRDGLGKSIVVPFAEYGFPLLTDEVDPVAFLKAITERGGTRIIKDASWSSVRGYNSAGFGGTETGTAIRLGLTSSFDALWHERFDKDVRRCVRTARANGVTVTPGTVDTFYPLYLATMERLGSPQFPPGLFSAFRDELGDAATILIAWLEEQPIAGVFCYEYGDTTTIWTPASLAAHWEHRPNHLLYLEAIKRACSAGRSIVDFGRSRPGSSVHEFKAQFGGTSADLVSLVAPPHRAGRASLDAYGRIGSITPYFAPILTNSTIGPALKRYLHE